MKSAVTVDDPRTRQVLRALGEAALALAEGRLVDDEWLLRNQAPARVAVNSAETTLLTVPEACAQLRISRWSFYRLIQQNQLHSVMIGRRRFVARSEISRFVTTLNGTGEQA